MPTTTITAAVRLKEKLAALRGPARLHPAVVHREIWEAHQDALRLCELIAKGD